MPDYIKFYSTRGDVNTFHYLIMFNLVLDYGWNRPNHFGLKFVYIMHDGAQLRTHFWVDKTEHRYFHIVQLNIFKRIVGSKNLTDI